MKRYDMKAAYDPENEIPPGVIYDRHPQGEWVRYEEAASRLAAADRLAAVAKRWRTIARLACACRARSRSHAAYQCIACEETAHLDAALADFEAKRKGEEIER